MSVKGIFLSDSGIQGELKTGDFAAAVLQTQPSGNAPFFALSAGMQSSNLSGSFIKNWFDETHNAGRIAITNTDANVTHTEIDVDDASGVISGSYYLVEETGELVYVVSVSSLAVTVARGFAGSTPAAFTNAMHLQRIGSAFEESSEAPVAVVDCGAPFYNFAQIFRNTWDVSNTAEALDFATGKPVARSKQTCTLQHAEDIERSLWFAKRWIGTRNGKPMRTMNGVDAQVTTNVTAAGATTTWTQIDTFWQGIFAKNIKGKPNERVAFCGLGAVAVLNGIAKINSQMIIQPGVTEFGMKVFKWITPYGEVSLLTHAMFTENPTWTKSIRVIHPGAVEICYLRRTTSFDNSQPGRDATSGGYTTELTNMLRCEAVFGRITGLTAAAAD